MGKISPRKMKEYERKEFQNALHVALHHIYKHKNPTLFADFLTESEQIMLVRRIAIAKRCIAGESVEAIRRELGVGITTVTAVEQWLRARFAEYRATLQPLYEKLRAQERRQRPIIPNSFRWLRRKYPTHFLLFNLLLDDIDWGEKRERETPRKRRQYN